VSLLGISLMLARRMKAMALRYSSSSARRRQRLIPAMVRSTTRASGDGLDALGLGGALDQPDPPGGIGHLVLRESVAITESRTIPTNQLLSGWTLIPLEDPSETLVPAPAAALSVP
jgi:hypothetical protein